MNTLVVLAPNWLGDAVMALPAIADLRRAWPGTAISVAARPAIAPLFQLVPDVHETFVLDRRPSIRDVVRWRSLGEELSGRGFEVALLLPNSIHAALLVSSAGIPERWGYATDLRRPLLTRSVRPAAGLHQGEYYQQLVQALGAPNGPVEPRVDVPSERRADGRRLLTEAGWDGVAPIVALAPGAAYGAAKRWAPESFAGLADALAVDGVRTVLVGTAADAPAGQDVLAAAARRETVMNLMGRTSVPVLAGVMAACRALVTNDSGAMHLAAAVGISVTAVFGPTDEQATAPRTSHDAPRTTILTHTVWCRPCMLRECPIDHRCMRGVGVTAVLDAARKAL